MSELSQDRGVVIQGGRDQEAWKKKIKNNKNKIEINKTLIPGRCNSHFGFLFMLLPHWRKAILWLDGNRYQSLK